MGLLIPIMESLVEYSWTPSGAGLSSMS
jgi:hypothetical protein